MELDRDQTLELAVQQAARAATTGSYAERNPVLGKMKTCPHCRRRRREQEVCCNFKYLQTNAGDMPRSAFAKKRRIPRLSRQRPPLFEMHDKLLEIEKRSECEQCGKAKQDHENWLWCDFGGTLSRKFRCREQEGISGIVEHQILRRRRTKSAKRRQQQEKSRKINRS